MHDMLINLGSYGQPPIVVTREQLFMLLQVGSLIHWSKDMKAFYLYAGVSHRMIESVLEALHEVLPVVPSNTTSV